MSLVVWVVVACALLWFAPRPPDPPAASEEELGVWSRTAGWAIRDVKRWQAQSGDHTIAWDEASGHLAIVIDDVGRELHLFDQLLSLRYRLTFSVLPGAVYAPGVQLRLRADRRRYREIFLHLPMEPDDKAKMVEGPEASETFLLTTDGPAQLRAKIDAAVARVPAAAGVNNHMGSKLTTDAEAMRVVMEEIALRDLVFIDSRTVAETVAEPIAVAHGIPTDARDVFIDHDPDRDAIVAALRDAASRSRDTPIIAIGHPSTAVVEVLTEELPRLHAQGIAIVPVSEILRRTAH